MTEPMTDDERKQIRERVDAAWKGPWYPIRICDEFHIADGPHYASDCVTSESQFNSAEANAAFMASARTDMPRLLDEVERLRAENAALRQQMEHSPKWCRVPVTAGMYMEAWRLLDGRYTVSKQLTHTRDCDIESHPEIAYYGPLPTSAPESTPNPEQETET